MDKTTTTIRIDAELLEWVRNQAQEEDRSANYIIIRAIEAHKNKLHK
mgnify:CR=1 FL=1